LAHFGIYELIVTFTVVVLVTWSLAWKGIALWHAARNGQRGWFIALLIVNTLGIFEIVYLLFFRQKIEPGPPLPR